MCGKDCISPRERRRRMERRPVDDPPEWSMVFVIACWLIAMTVSVAAFAALEGR